MKILKEGTLPEKRVPKYRGTCSNCGCQVECEPTDEAVLPYSRSQPRLVVICPTTFCKTNIVLAEYIER